MKLYKISFVLLAVTAFVRYSMSAELPPADENGKITLSESATVDDAEGAAALAAARAIELAQGVTLTYTANAPLELSAAVSGSGVFAANSSGQITLSADNSALIAPGHFAFSNTPVLVTSETGLGGGASGAVKFFGIASNGNVTNNMLRFVGSASVFTNYAPIAMSQPRKNAHGTFYFGAQNAGGTLVQAGDFSVELASTGYNPAIYFKYNVEFICSKLALKHRPYIHPYGADGVLRFGENVEADMGSGWLTIVYHNKLRLACKSLKSYGFSTDSTRNIIFESSNCLSATTPLWPYARNSNGVMFNLNGFDQTVAYLRQQDAKADYWSSVSSDLPAVLTSAGTATGSDTVRYKITGAVSYCHDTPRQTTFTQYKLMASGALTVSKGKVTFASGSGWAGDSVIVKSGAALVCNSSASLDSGSHVLRVEQGGALEVAQGVTLIVASAELGGVQLEKGKYFTLQELRESEIGEKISLAGDGAILTSAASVSGEWNGWPEAGTVEEVSIPDGTEVIIEDDDAEKVSALSRIAAGRDTRIVCRALRNPLVLAASLSGGARFEARDCAQIVLAGDNSRLSEPGGFFFSNTTVVVSNRWGLGSRSTKAAEFWPAAPLANNYSMLRFGGDALTNDAAIVFNYGFRIGHLEPSRTVVMNNDVVQKSGAYDPLERNARFLGNIAIATNATMTVHTPYLNSDVELRIERGATLNSSWGTYGNGYVYDDGTWNCTLAIEQGTRRFVFERENAITAADCKFYDASDKKFFFDLNGFDQTLPRVDGNSYYNSNQQCFDVTSASPATLTLNAGAGRNTGAAIRCLDQASLAQSGASTQTIGFAVSTTTGSLTVNSGAIALERNAKWYGTNVVINGGELIVRASAATNTFGVGRASKTDLYINGGGKLHLDSDAYVTAVRSVTRDGKLLVRGIYSAENCDWITGPGAVRAVKGWPTGLMMIVR